jgi:hypothetical protein
MRTRDGSSFVRIDERGGCAGIHSHLDDRGREIPGGRLRAREEMIAVVIDRVDFHEIASRRFDPFVREHAPVERYRGDGTKRRQCGRNAEELTRVGIDHLKQRLGIDGVASAEVGGHDAAVAPDAGRGRNVAAAPQRVPGHERQVDKPAPQGARFRSKPQIREA